MAKENGFALMFRPESDRTGRIWNPCGIKPRDQFIAFGDDETISALRRLIAERLNGGELRVREKKRIPPVVENKREEFGEIVAWFRGHGTERA